MIWRATIIAAADILMRQEEKVHSPLTKQYVNLLLSCHAIKTNLHMLSKLSYIVILILLCASCKGPEARRPVQSHSGTFIKESAERNKEIYDREKKFIEAIIAQDS